MTEPLYRLSDDVVAEPLVNSFPSWWMTLAPVPSCLHLVNYQLPLLKAYLQNPQFHAKAGSDPTMLGASFVTVPAARAEEVRALLHRSQTQLASRCALAEAFDMFQQGLVEEAKGQSLEPLYARLPEPLRGLVELVYDYHNRPALRLLEALTYRDGLDTAPLQTLLFSKLTADLDRPFWVSTPRLPEASTLELKLPLRAERLDRIFRTDLHPAPLAEWGELLEVDPERPELRRLLTEAPPQPAASWAGPGVRVRYVGHACVLVEWKGQNLLLDPFLSAVPSAPAAPRLRYSELPERIDFALVTHSHADHFWPETLLRLRHRIGTLVVPRASGMLVGDASLKRIAQSIGFRQVVELDALDSLPLDDGEIVGTPFLGEHGDLALSKTGYWICLGQERLLFGADSAGLDPGLYRELRARLGQVGSVFMNTETEGSPLTFSMEALFPKKRDRRLERNRRCRGSTAAEGLMILDTLGAKRVFNYAMGLEPWLSHIVGPPSSESSKRMEESTRLIDEAQRRGLTAQRLNGPTEIVLG